MASSESLLISAIVRTGEIGPLLAEELTPDMLSVHPHELEWLLEMYEEIGHVPDHAAFMAQWPSFVVYQTDDLQAHAVAVKRRHNEDRLVKMAGDVIGLLEVGDIDEALQLMSTELLHIQSGMTKVSDCMDLTNEWAEVFDLVEDKVDRVRMFGQAGVPTGWSVIDANTGGWQSGWLCILAGRLGAGKTWAMIRSACEAALNGKTVIYFSLEQSRHQIAMRAQSMLAAMVGAPRVNSLEMLKGTVRDTDELRTSLRMIEAGVQGRFLINDTSRGQIGPMQIAAVVDRVKAESDGDVVVFIDYLTLLSVNKPQGDWRDVARLSADLKRLAERYEVPVIAGAQLNRTAAGQDFPDASQLAQSDAIGQDADIVIALQRPEPAAPVMRMGLIKNRHGADQIRWWVKFDPANGCMEEISGDQAEQLILRSKEVD